ncbi:MAG TPA: glycosyltransferase family 39 protein, partial [Candidatus Hypogeohydataceae bacterium YC38]
MNDSFKSIKGIISKGLSRPVTAITILDTFSLLLLFLYLGFFFYRASVVLFFPYAFPLEVPYAVQVKMLGEGGSLYELYDLNRSDTKIPCAHGPVHPLLVGFLVHSFGFSFILGRLVGLIFCLFLGVIISLFVWRETRDIFCSAVSALLFFASPSVYNWVACFRSMEFLGVTFCFIGMYIIQYYRHSKWVYTSAVLFTLGVYTKFYLVSAPIAALIYLLLEDRKLAIRMGSLFLLLSAAVFLSLNHVTHGQYYANIVAARVFMGDFEMYGAPYFYILFIMCPVLI